MNENHHHRLVKAMYEVHNSPALDKYGSRIFGHPIQGTWKLFRYIVKTATADVWLWRPDKELASYPGKVIVPSFNAFTTLMCHEAAHGWCYFHKDNLDQLDYPTGVDEEKVCWDVSRLVCKMLHISYQKKLADISYQYHLHVKYLRQLEEKMPSHLQFPKN